MPIWAVAATMQATPSFLGGGAGVAPSILLNTRVRGRSAVAGRTMRTESSLRRRAVFARVAGVSGRGA